jgi:hypothetical protein
VPSVYTIRLGLGNVAPGGQQQVACPAGHNWVVRAVDGFVQPASATQGFLILRVNGITVAAVQTNSTALFAIHYLGYIGMTGGEVLTFLNATDGTAGWQATGYQFLTT